MDFDPSKISKEDISNGLDLLWMYVLMDFDPSKISKEDISNGLDLLWMYVLKAEGRCKNTDSIMRLQICQTYDYLNRIGYTKHLPADRIELNGITDSTDIKKNVLINDDSVSTCGTCLQGEIDISYDELFEKLGNPVAGDGYKVDAEWVLKFEDGTVATIYNYKDGKNYNGEHGLETQDIRNWHIGGGNDKSLENVCDLLGIQVPE